ncbi:MAG: protein kinase [Planctomycetes bacterium]|nr:protein kinase [Planctomycetota bacterium]
MQIEVTVRQGREFGRRYVIRIGQRFVLGRGRDVTVRVQDEKVSRRHVALELSPEGLMVTDLGSRNGSFLDGRQLKPNEAKLAHADDVLQIGDHVFQLSLTGVDDRTRRERARTRRLDEPLLPRDEFEILGEIGRGATGRVYAAHQKLLGRNVAIKVLRQDADPDEESRARFMREGRVCVKIDSPYVVDVHDVRLADGRIFLIMELVNGLSVKDRLFGGPLTIPESIQIGEEVALGLAAAHAAGIVHRDIKPANILLTPEGRAKVGDFGIAKEMDGIESLTATGEGLGTLAYVSPEQATEAKEVSFKTDIYSLGATIYHMIAGRPPFLPTSAKVLLEILDVPAPSILVHRPECPPEIAAVIDGMLVKDPTKRAPESASEVASLLRALRKEHYPNHEQTPEWSIADSGEGIRPDAEDPGDVAL